MLETCIDLLQAAWHLEDDEFELLLGVPQGWLCAWRVHERHDVPWQRARRLIRFHEALRYVARPTQYGDYLRRRWREGSPIGHRSILETILAEGDPAMDLIEQYITNI
jgi:hypothetical protein